jgi:hypothetical protein
MRRSAIPAAASAGVQARWRKRLMSIRPPCGAGKRIPRRCGSAPSSHDPGPHGHPPARAHRPWIILQPPLPARASTWARWGSWSRVEVEGGGRQGPGSVRVLVRAPFRVRERITEWVPHEQMAYELIDGMRVRATGRQSRPRRRPKAASSSTGAPPMTAQARSPPLCCASPCATRASGWRRLRPRRVHASEPAGQPSCAGPWLCHAQPFCSESSLKTSAAVERRRASPSR